MTERVANRICEARKLAGLSPDQVAKMLNLPVERILEIEAGTVSVSAQEIEKFAEIFEVSKSWLMGKQALSFCFSSPPSLEDLFGITLPNLTPEEWERIHTILSSMRGN